MNDKEQKAADALLKQMELAASMSNAADVSQYTSAYEALMRAVLHRQQHKKE